MRHIISVLLENESGALSRVSGLFSARGFNIESLVVAETNDPSLSRLTLVTVGNNRVVEQIVKQLEKLIDTVAVIDLTQQDHVERELLLAKVSVSKNKDKVQETVRLFNAKIVDQSDSTFVIEYSGESSQLDAFLSTLEKDTILEISRTGAMGLYCGPTIS